MKRENENIKQSEKTFTLITGACGGLGKSFVTECAIRGENLILTGTSENKLEKLLSEFSEKLKSIEVKTFVCNLASKTDRENLVNFIKSEQLTISKLINNAGVIIEGDIERFSDDEIENAVMVNCVGTLDLTKKIIDLRDKEKNLYILTVSSVASEFPIPHMAVYSATKSFLVSVMTALAYEYRGKKVYFTTTCPGGMATTLAMKESIKSMGFGGKLSCMDTRLVAKKSLRALDKHRVVFIPGRFNRFLAILGKPFPVSFLAKKSGKIWAKSQKKRKF